MLHKVLSGFYNLNRPPDDRPQSGIRTVKPRRVLVHRVLSEFRDPYPRRMASPQPGIRTGDTPRILAILAA